MPVLQSEVNDFPKNTAINNNILWIQNLSEKKCTVWAMSL